MSIFSLKPEADSDQVRPRVESSRVTENVLELEWNWVQLCTSRVGSGKITINSPEVELHIRQTGFLDEAMTSFFSILEELAEINQN